MHVSFRKMPPKTKEPEQLNESPFHSLPGNTSIRSPTKGLSRTGGKGKASAAAGSSTQVAETPMPIRTKSTTLPHQTTVVDLVEYESRSATVALALEPLTFCRPDPRGERGERRHAQRRPQTQHQLRRGICDRYCITDHEAAADDEASQLRKQIHYQQQRWQKLPTEFRIYES